MVSSGSDRPLIGLTTYVERAQRGPWDEVAALLPINYVAAVARAGGTPLLLPPSPAEPASVLGVLQGLIVTGGPDVDPALYGAEPHAETDQPRPERDAWETALCQAALEMDLPLLAICRGLQVLNVARGGTLVQHLPEAKGTDAHRPVLGRMAPNRVRITAGSALAGLLGPSARILCHHHQAIRRLGNGLTATAVAPDGVVEGVEVEGHSFAIGVQWHPETDETDDRLITALVEEAVKYGRAAGQGGAGARVDAGRGSSACTA